MNKRRRWIKGQPERSHLKIPNLFLLDIPISPAETTWPNHRLRLERNHCISFKFLTSSESTEEGGHFLDDTQIWFIDHSRKSTTGRCRSVQKRQRQEGSFSLMSPPTSKLQLGQNWPRESSHLLEFTS